MIEVFARSQAAGVPQGGQGQSLREAIAGPGWRLAGRGRRGARCAAQATLWGLLAVVASAALRGGEPAVWQRKLQAQQQAQAAAESLVASVLEVQLRQLEENGLGGLPVYREIAEMKRHLRQIAAQPMDQIAALLQRLAEAPVEEQPALEQAVRAKVREVVAALVAERQRIYRRLKVAHLAAEVQQLLARQVRTQAATQALPAAEASQRPRLALAVQEDQTDVHRGYLQLLAMLQDVRSWGGPAAESAARGLALLRVAQTEDALRAVAQSLAQADFSAAVQSQQAVVDALTLLLAELESSQGLDAAGREAALTLIRELAAQQQALRQQTQQAAATPPQAALLVDKQTAVHRQLGQLASMLRRFPATAPLVQAAQEAALQAASELFQERPEPALAHQAQVLSHLAHLEDFLEAEEARSGDKSADALAEEVARLQTLHETLQRLSEAWPAAADRVAEVQALAAGLEAAQPLAERGPAPVAAQFSQTQEHVSAWQRLRQAASRDALQAASEAAQRAFTQLQAEVAAAWADTQRRQRAVTVGELARAAETLERAAATQRDIARRLAEPSAVSGPANPPVSQEPAAATSAEAPPPGLLASEQRQVASVTAKVAAGVQHTAEHVHQELVSLAAALEALAEQVAAAEAAEPTDALRVAAAAKAQSQHGALVEAAAQLRRAQGQAAAELGTVARQQRERTADVRQQVEQARPADDAAVWQEAAAWQAVGDLLRQAQATAARAIGRGSQATAQHLEDQLVQARRLQAAAEAAAEALASGRSPDPLAAAMVQQDVADRLAEAAALASPLRPMLQRASQQAAQAARELLHGRHLAAQAARQELRAALTEADQALPPYLSQVQRAPAGPPDAKAREELVQQMEQAAKAVEKAAGAQAANPMDPAGETAGRLRSAAAALHAAVASEEGPPIDPAVGALTQAQAHVQSALDNAARRQQEALARQAAAAQATQPIAAKVDAGAAAALGQAESLARRGQTSSLGLPPPPQVSQRVQEKWEQAVANLTAREGRLRRDEELAQLLASLALAQQAARETIAQLSQQLERPTPSTAQPANVDETAAQVAQRQELAGQLFQAEHQFAFAQTVTGQAATEVSGQVEVANVPLREALRLASAFRLPQPLPQPPAGPSAEASAEERGAGTGDVSPSPASAASGSPANQKQAASAQAASAGQGQAPMPTGASQASGGAPPTGSGASPAQPGGERSLGTQLVPASPQVTARQIAGPQAQAVAQASGMGEQAAGASAQGQGSSGTGDSPSPDGAATAAARKGGAVQKGPAAPNQKPPQGDLETAEAAQADSRGQRTAEGTTPGGSFLGGGSDVWMARLPPELRAAIQARSRRLPPRGYEERLKRYFESVP